MNFRHQQESAGWLPLRVLFAVVRASSLRIHQQEKEDCTRFTGTSRTFGTAASAGSPFCSALFPVDPRLSEASRSLLAA